MGARRFAPDTARFLQPDFFRGALDDLSLSMDPLSGNRYSLAAGNPVSFIESDGHRVESTSGGSCSCPTNDPERQRRIQSQIHGAVAPQDGFQAAGRSRGGSAGAPEGIARALTERLKIDPSTLSPLGVLKSQALNAIATYQRTQGDVLQKSLAAANANNPVSAVLRSARRAGTAAAWNRTADAWYHGTNALIDGFALAGAAGGISSVARGTVITRGAASTSSTSRMSGLLADEAGSVGLRRFSPHQDAVIQLAKERERLGWVSADDAKVLLEWAEEYGLKSHGVMVHPGRVESMWSQIPHITIGPVSHIPVR